MTIQAVPRHQPVRNREADVFLRGNRAIAKSRRTLLPEAPSAVPVGARISQFVNDSETTSGNWAAYRAFYTRCQDARRSKRLVARSGYGSPDIFCTTAGCSDDPDTHGRYFPLSTNILEMSDRGRLLSAMRHLTGDARFNEM